MQIDNHNFQKQFQNILFVHIHIVIQDSSILYQYDSTTVSDKQ